MQVCLGCRWIHLVSIAFSLQSSIEHIYIEHIYWILEFRNWWKKQNWEVFCSSLHQKENELYLQWLIHIYFDLWHRPRVAFYCEDERDREDFEGVGPTNLPTTNDGPNPTYADPIHSIDHLPPKSYKNQPKSPLMRTKNRGLWWMSAWLHH